MSVSGNHAKVTISCDENEINECDVDSVQGHKGGVFTRKVLSGKRLTDQQQENFVKQLGLSDISDML
jgi:hypothetical protein